MFISPLQQCLWRLAVNNYYHRELLAINSQYPLITWSSKLEPLRVILDTKLTIPGIAHVNIGESHITIEVIRNIFTEMFCYQYERQESLFKSHEKTVLSIISSNIQITVQQQDKFH